MEYPSNDDKSNEEDDIVLGSIDTQQNAHAHDNANFFSSWNHTSKINILNIAIKMYNGTPNSVIVCIYFLHTRLQFWEVFFFKMKLLSH